MIFRAARNLFLNPGRVSSDTYSRSVKFIKSAPKARRHMAEQNKILVVDDELEVRELLKEVLEEEGYFVLTAKDGVEGFDMAMKKFPNLILLDMNMPRMSGMEVYHKLYNQAQKKSTFPVLCVTARGDLEDLFLELNVEGFITKPFKLETIIDHVNVIFEKRYGRKKAAASSAASPFTVLSEEAPSGEPARKAQARTKTYLIVDEGANALGKVVTYFSNYGYEPKFANTAMQAINFLMEKRYDALLVNMNLPDLPGDLLLFKLREMPRTMDLPVILYSSKPIDKEVSSRILQKTGMHVSLLSENSADLFNACKDMLQKLRGL